MPRALRPVFGPLLAQLNAMPRSAALLIGAWVLTMILVPIQLWLFVEQALPFAISVATLLQAAAVIVLLVGALGTRRVLLMMAIALPLAWAFEYVGHTTDIPFGAYAYTEVLQPQIGGVPFILPFAWFMMLSPSWAVAFVITRALDARLKLPVWRRQAAFLGFSALAMTAWDFFLDPQMVGWDLWRWDAAGSYFGIPWVNFAGWLLATIVITAAAMLVFKPQQLPVRPLLLIYAICWALEWGGLIFIWGLPGPGIVGFFVMGVPLALALWAEFGTQAAGGLRPRADAEAAL